MRQIDLKQVAEELCRELAAIFPGSGPASVEGEVRAEVATSTDPVDVMVADDGCLVVEIQTAQAEPLRAMCRPLVLPTKRDLKLAKALGRIFRDDLHYISDLRRDREVWTALSSSRMPRVIARFSAFNTAPFVSWLEGIAAARSQTYEGQAFRAHVLFTKQLSRIADATEQTFVPLSTPLLLNDALYAEKWLRPVLADTGLALVVVGHAGRVAGFTTCDPTSDVSAGTRLVPHQRLAGLYDLVVPGTAAVSLGSTGDLLVALPRGPMFGRSQHGWRYQTYGGVNTLISEIEPQVLHAILQTALNSSFDRSGALFIVVTDPATVSEMVPDHHQADRINATLRNSIHGLSLDLPGHRKFVSAAAAADGAVVFSSDGRILDAACMISEPTEARLRQNGHTVPRRFSGARTTAAWNASFFGISIKVSEDGPIDVFRAGKLIAQLG